MEGHSLESRVYQKSGVEYVDVLVVTRLNRAVTMSVSIVWRQKDGYVICKATIEPVHQQILDDAHDYWST